MPLKHRFISTKPDSADTSLVRPSNWNEDHKVEPGIRGSVLFVGENQSVSEDNTNLFWDNANKRLGIGTNAPSERLHVIGNVRIDDAYKLTWSDVNLYRAGANLLKTDSSLAIGTLTTGSILFAGSNGVISQDNAKLFWDNVNKRLGIGTNTPSYTLHVVGDVAFDGEIFYREKRPFGVLGNVLGRAVVYGSITANKGTNPEYSIIEGLVHYWYVANSDVVEPYPQITYDLGGIVYHIREVRVYSDWFSEYYPVDFKVEISSDGSTWTTIANVVGNNSPFWSIKGIWNFRYLRITVTKANGSYDVHIKAAAYSTLGGSYGSFVFSNFTVAHWANINFITFGYNQKDTNLYRGAADQLKTDDSFVAMGNIGVGTGYPEFKLDARGNLGINRIADADSTNTLRNSFNLVLRGAYWSGSASVNRDAAIFHRMLSTTPTSEIAFQIAGVDMATLSDSIADGETALLLRRNVGGTYSVVRVSMGPPDSGGTGYRVLRVPN